MADPNFAMPCYYYQTCPPAFTPPPYAFHPFQPPDYSPPIPPYVYHQPQPPPYTPYTPPAPYTCTTPTPYNFNPFVATRQFQSDGYAPQVFAESLETLKLNFDASNDNRQQSEVSSDLVSEFPQTPSHVSTIVSTAPLMFDESPERVRKVVLLPIDKGEENTVGYEPWNRDWDWDDESDVEIETEVEDDSELVLGGKGSFRDSGDVCNEGEENWDTSEGCELWDRSWDWDSETEEGGEVKEKGEVDDIEDIAGHEDMGLFGSAMKVCDEMPVRDVPGKNVVLPCYSHDGQWVKVWGLIELNSDEVVKIQKTGGLISSRDENMKSREVENKSNLSRAVKNYTDSVVYQFVQAVAEGAKLLQDRISATSFKSFKQMETDNVEEVEGDEMREQLEETTESSGLPVFHIEVFKDLGSGDVSVRVAAVEKLVMKLKEIQKFYEKVGKKDESGDGLSLEVEKDDGLGDCAPSVRYAVRRLIRGVSSSRECARQGFALGLTVLIGAIPCIEVQSLLKLIVNLLEVSSSMKGQDIKDCLLGCLLAYGAVARSGRLIKEKASDKNCMLVKDFVGSLISLASKKRYLQEPSVVIILDLVDKLPIEVVLHHILEAPGLQKWFEGAPETGNSDALLLALKMRAKVSIDNEVFGKLLPYPYSSSRLFSATHLSFIANCLKESTFCQPRVHNTWPALVDILLPDGVLKDTDTVSGLTPGKKHKKHRKSNSSEEDVEKNLRCFWETIIEDSLLLSSHDRKHLAFDVLLLLLPKLPTSCLSIVLSSKFVQCMIDILSTKTSWLYKVAQHFLKELSDWVGYDEVRIVAVVVALQKHSNGKFDCITRTKTIKDYMAKFTTESGCMLFIQNLMDMFLDEGHTSEEPSDHSQTTDDNSEIGSVEDKDSTGTLGTSDFLKTWAIDSLPGVLKYIKIDQEAKFGVQKEILKFLAVQGLFSSSLGTEVTSFELQEKFRWPKVPTSSSLCRLCIEQLQLLLKNAQKGEGPHAVAGGLEANDLGSYFMRFFSTLRNIPSVSLFRVLSNEDEKALKKLQAMEAYLAREERNCGLSTDSHKLHSFRYLLIQLLLQVLLQPEEFIEAASELIICCKKAFPSSDLDFSGDDEPDSDETPELMDVLVDTLLSLLPQSSAPVRSAIEQVFKYFCDGVTDDGLLRMLRVIKKDLKPARHQDIDSEEDEEDDDDLLGIEEAEESDEGETAETGNSDEQNDDGDDDEAVDGGQLIVNEISQASDESDGGMDDDAMFRMDSYLAQIFREKKNQAGGETAQSQLVLFKLRVLSLLEIYLHENPGKPQVVKVFSYLVQAFVNPHTTEGSEQLGQRIWGIIQKKIFKAKEHPKGEAIQLSMLESLLEKNLKLASKPFKRKKHATNPSEKKQSASYNRYKMINSLAQKSTFWILKVIDSRSFPKSELQRIFDIFKGVLASYFDSKKSELKCDFLKEIFRRPWLGHNLFGYLIKKCGSAKSKFRQVEALALVTEILKSLVSVNADGSGQEVSKKMLKSHIPKLCNLMKELMTNMPDKQAKRAEVRKFCARVFQTLTSLKLSASFLKSLEPEVHAACELQLGKTFLDFKSEE